jgi:hypothetical protein
MGANELIRPATNHSPRAQMKNGRLEIQTRFALDRSASCRNSAAARHIFKRARTLMKMDRYLHRCTLKVFGGRHFDLQTPHHQSLNRLRARA